MSFHEQLTDKLAKERGGRHGGKGHEFQRYWALCHLLKLDLEQSDYLILIEYIEDVAVLNAEQAPTMLNLFQLKKKDGGAAWTKAALMRPPKDSRSVLAKLCESQKSIPDSNACVAFVSNAPVSLTLANELDSTQQSEFSWKNLDEALKAELQSAVVEELSCQHDDIQWENLRFVKCELALNDLEKHAQGHVVSYLAQKFPDHNARADVLCKALYAEIAVRATNTQDAASFDELRKMRGIGKSQFSEMLTVTLSRKPALEVLEDAINVLAQEKVPFVERRAIGAAGRRYMVERVGRTNLALAALEQHVATLRDCVPDDLVTLWEVASWIFEQIQRSSDWHAFSAMERTYVLAVILYGVNQ